MIKKSAKYFVGAIAAAGLFFYVRYYALTFPVVIVYTNDLHGNILPRKGEGGAASIAAFLKTQPEDALLLDGGDFFQGTPESDLSKGRNTVLVMNRLGYDAAAVGNHEFDFGQKNLAELARVAEFPLLSANIYEAAGKIAKADGKTAKHSGRHPTYIKPYIIKEVKGARVAIFGLTSERTPAMSMPANVRGLMFDNATLRAGAVVGELKDRADVVIALSHIGFEKDTDRWRGDRALAAAVEGIDVIIGAHTHTEVRGKKVGRTLIVQTRGGGRSVGEMTIRLDRKTKKPRLITNRIVKISSKKFGEDASLAAFVEKISAATSRKLSKVVAVAEADIARGAKGGESALGSLLADIMSERAGTDMAFHNPGGIRADFKKGDITLRDVYNVNPFDNTIVTMKLSGLQIRELLEKSLTGQYGTLQISGIRMRYERVSKKLDVSAITAGKTSLLDDKKLYTVATNSFLAAGGDGFSPFAAGKNKRDTGVNFRDAVTEYLLKGGTLPARRGMSDGRIEIK
ncbi:MAG: bifunctional UDP-sugar hydrolase/5'-nucleotidase [Endomicrobiia bacterium]|nr:bifunctional UDP-sugar hydrolase/5'-nucleotidase [Endomicrobiia bacterium]